MKINNRSSEKGFVIITVMILTMMASTVVLTSLQDTTVQERLSGNFQKKMNSRMMAEKGVFDAFKEMDANIVTMGEANNTEAEIIAALQGSADVSGNAVEGGEGSYLAKIEAVEGSSNEISITSAGALHEGKTRLQGIFKIVAGNTIFPNASFSKGITSCQSVGIVGSSIIDSYNSTNGAYGDDLGDGLLNKGDQITVQTLVTGQDGGIVTLTGAGRIDGDLISATGVSITGGINVTGNVKVQGGITFSGSTAIGGGMFALGNITQINQVVQNPDSPTDSDGDSSYDLVKGYGTVGGNIQANGNVILSGITVGGVVPGNVISGEYIDDDSTAPALNKKGMYLHNSTVTGNVRSLSNIYLNVSRVTGNVATYLNYLQITGAVTGNVKVGGIKDIRQGGSQGSLRQNVPTDELPTITPLTLADVSPESTSQDTETPPDCAVDGAAVAAGVDTIGALPGLAPESLTIAESETIILSNTTVSDDDSYRAPHRFGVEFMEHRFDMFTYTDVTINGTLKIEPLQHITMYVQGNFMMDKEGPAELIIPENSSLTIIIKGRLVINGGTVSTPTRGVGTSGKPALTIFSAYNNKDSNVNNANDDIPDSPIYDGNDTDPHRWVDGPQADKAGIHLYDGLDSIYAVIHAPLTNVEITNGVDFKGAIYANNVKLSGSSKVHFDTALNNATLKPRPDRAQYPIMVFQGWRYITEEESSDE